MDKVVTFHFTDDFIACLADYIDNHFVKQGVALSRLAIVFGGKRPALFLKRALAKRTKTSFISPCFFSIEEFIQYLISSKEVLRIATDLDVSFLIWQVARDRVPALLGERKTFAEFLPWAREIAAFIDELDLEEISDRALGSIQASAEIGYEVPDSINALLSHIVILRGFYHAALRQRNQYSRGLLYKEAAQRIRESIVDEFDRIIFCNFFYLHKTEERIAKYLSDCGKAMFFFQADNAHWPVFGRLSKSLGLPIVPPKADTPKYEAKIYKGFDSHSQVGLARHIITQELPKGAEVRNKTLILLSDPNNLIPLLSELVSELDEFNVSLGYPLQRSSLYSLLQYIFRAQARRANGVYYTRDYLKVILHPLIKNLLVTPDPTHTRILVHKLEEILLGMVKADISGNLFVKLDEIEQLQELYRLSAQTMLRMEVRLSTIELKEIVRQVHELVFRLWEDIADFAHFISSLERFSQALLTNSLVGHHPLNMKILERIYMILDELKDAEFKDQPFQPQEIYKIFDNKLRTEVVSFSCSPLKGLQVLGLFESRALNFENIIVMDANEGVLPSVRVYEPLIPRQIMEGLGLERLRQEEEIQRYHFMRLVGGAKRVFFLYDDSPEMEKSRFLEQIIWERQKGEGRLEVLSESQARFNVSSKPPGRAYAKKTSDVVAYLFGEFTYSVSSIDTYLACPLKFYYRYVLGLEEKEDLLNEPEGKDVGIVIHGLLEAMFRRFLGDRPVLDERFEEEFFREFELRFNAEIGKRMKDEAFMVKEIIRLRLANFLKNERRRSVKKVISLEEQRTGECIRWRERSVNFQYRIDRIDVLEDSTILIIDYKTGGSAAAPVGLNALVQECLNHQVIKDKIRSFQLPLYYYFVSQRYPDTPVNAALYNLRTTEFTYFIRPRQSGTAQQYLAICLSALEFIVSQILNAGIDFEADTSGSGCEYCAFRMMCT